MDKNTEKELKPATDQEKATWASGQKILAIKMYRERLGAGLVDAYCVFHGMTVEEHQKRWRGE